MRKRNFVLFVSLALITWAGVTYHLFLQRPLASKAFRPGKLQSQLEQLEQKLQEQVRANAELLGNLRDLKKQLSEPSNDTGGRQSGDKPVIAVLLFACNRVTVKRPIDQLIQYRPSKEQFPIIVSQDCNHAMTTNVIKAYGNELTLIRQPDQSDIPLVGKEKKFKGYYKIARHYGWALNKTFHDLMYDTVIIVEDDLELSVDFFEYFLALYPILKNDPTLYCVSAWNDNGKAGLVAEDSEHLHRSDFFPGLGWMLTKDLWLELHTKWPKSFWDDWIRQPEQRRDRACIRPEVSRTKTFGKIGVSNGLFFEKHLKFIQLNKKFVPFLSKDLSHLKKDNYDVAFVKEVYGCPSVTLTQLLKGNLDTKGPVRVTYNSKELFKNIAKKLAIMDDFKSGVPRTGYRGVVSMMFKGRRVYVAPPADWKGYNKSWS
ncbi:alpha-1,3-mannosyl-glycoprotein 2-beta-N-acetylglucosaminyltransferase [Ixodes scapularis]|uniref:alpha-1,3-mannosyl-glycoprotein 2-beta-N-acetylglucosaminyltransferase n=1 Tax=Ixodes scapularis TaxID=6945 RepID=UPI001161A720|nr:alpha-1,3-mannosyl-glycoprotein 2-beta-N-acetylglucosaminyltransferase [Ixodes scapularis]XP_029826897.3 alpha-1,3-mannosyl-glycoprotein 2-beta-N-acetylglucosaminyltransferase [Ixodes scapularis]